jgi:hypothetical protein
MISNDSTDGDSNDDDFNFSLEEIDAAVAEGVDRARKAGK